LFPTVRDLRNSLTPTAEHRPPKTERFVVGSTWSYPKKSQRNQNNNKVREARPKGIRGRVDEAFARAWKAFAHLPVGSQVGAGIFNQT